MGDTGAGGDSFTFSAFISYAREDRAEAVRLQRRLEQYRLDADLRVKEGERLFPARPLQPIFRDEDELVPGQDLPERIRKGLAASRFLIVVASTASVRSRWVEKEILDFIALGKSDRIIILVIDGEPNAVRAGKKPEFESLPRPFRVKFVDGQPTEEPVAEPNWVDWRGHHKNDRINFLRLVAALLQLDRFDDLLRRDARNERRRLRLFQAATSVFVLLGLAAAVGGVLSAQQLNAVRATESRFLARLADELGEPADDAANGDHLRAMQVAIEGAPTATGALYPRPLTLETEVALRRSISHLRLRRFFQHEEGVRAATLSPDGRRVVTISRAESPSADDAIVTFWDASNGALVGSPVKIESGSFADLFEVSFSPDGRRVLAVAGDAVRLFDPQSGESIGGLLNGDRGVEQRTARFGADGRRALVDDVLWDARTGAKIRALGAGEQIDAALNRIVAVQGSDTTQLIDVASGVAVGSPAKHDAGVIGVAFSKTRIAVATRNNEVSLFDAVTGAPLSVVIRTAANLAAIDFSPDGLRLITRAGKADGSNEARLWNVETGAAVGAALVAPSAIEIMFDATGKRMAVQSKDLQIMDTATGAIRSVNTGGAGSADSFSPDGEFLLVRTDDGAMLLVNAGSGEVIGAPMVRTGDVVAAQFSPDSTRFLLGSVDGVGLWTTTGRFLDELKHDDPVSNARFGTVTHLSALTASFSADGSTIVTSSSDKSARLWSAEPSLLAPTTPSPAGRVLAVSPSGEMFATLSSATVYLWNARSGAPIGRAMTAGAVQSAAFSPDGARLLTVADADVRLWDARSGSTIGAPMKHPEAVTAAIFSPDGMRVATASQDKTARLWNAQTGVPTGAAMTHADDVRSVAFSPDGLRLLTTSGTEEGAQSDGTLTSTGEARLWDALTGAPLGRAMKHAGLVKGATFSPDGSRVATASFDNIARIWDGHTGAPLRTLNHSERVSSVHFSPDGSRILTLSLGELDFSGGAHLWNAETGRRIADLPQGNPTVGRFSPDGTRVATAGFGAEAALFDARDGKPIAVMTHSRDGSLLVTGARFSPDGTVLVTGGGGFVRLWDARTGVSIGSPFEGDLPDDHEPFAAGGARLLTTTDRAAQIWSIAAWSERGGSLVAAACKVLKATRTGPLPRDLNDRAFRTSGAPHPCERRGLLDWRFYTEMLAGGR